MRGFFERLFNLYPGEHKKALLFACLGFLWSLAISLGLRFSDALFLLHVGAESLPTIYKLIPCGMLTLSVFLIYTYHKFDTYKIFLAILFAEITFYLGAYICLQLGVGVASQWIWYVLRVTAAIFLTMTITIYWTFIDRYHHFQDAKRMYGLFSSAIFLGATFTGLLMSSGLFTFAQLTLFIAATLGAAAILVRIISQNLTPTQDETEQIETPSPPLKSLVSSIARSPFTCFLIMSNFLIFLLWVTTEFNYLTAFDHHFDPEGLAQVGTEEKAELTIFIGKVFGIVSFSNIFIGLFLYSRMVRGFGLSNLLLLTPLLFIVTFLGWQFTTSLAIPLLGYFIVEGLLIVVDDSNFSLLVNAVPNKVKHKVRVIIETFFEPIGMLTSGILMSMPGLNTKILGLVLSFLLLAMILGVRRNYLKAIYSNLADNAVHFHWSVVKWFRRMSSRLRCKCEYRLLGYLKHGVPELESLAIETLLACNDPAILKKLLIQLDEYSVKEKKECLKILSESPLATDPMVLQTVVNWSQEPDLKDPVEFYLAYHGQLKDLDMMRDEVIEKHLQSPNTEEICRGLKLLRISEAPSPINWAVPFLSHPSERVATTAARTVNDLASPDSLQHAAHLLSLLSTESPHRFKVACLEALGKMADPSLAPGIVRAVLHFRPQERRCTAQSLASMSTEVVPAMLSLLEDAKEHDRSRLLAGQVLGKIHLKGLRNHLEWVLSEEISHASFYLYYAHMMRKEEEKGLDVKILTDALFSRYHSVMNFIIQLLGVAGELEDCEMLARYLKSGSRKLKSQVIEALEKTTDPRIFHILLPLIDEVPIESWLQSYEKAHGAPLSLTRLLEQLKRSPATADQIVAIAMLHRLNIPGWKEALKEEMGDGELFHHFACELLQT